MPFLLVLIVKKGLKVWTLSADVFRKHSLTWDLSEPNRLAIHKSESDFYPKGGSWNRRNRCEVFCCDSHFPQKIRIPLSIKKNQVIFSIGVSAMCCKNQARMSRKRCKPRYRLYSICSSSRINVTTLQFSAATEAERERESPEDNDAMFIVQSTTSDTFLCDSAMNRN